MKKKSPIQDILHLKAKSVFQFPDIEFYRLYLIHDKTGLHCYCFKHKIDSFIFKKKPKVNENYL